MNFQVIIVDVNCLVQEKQFNIYKTLLPPKDGVKEFLEELSSKYTVKLYYRGDEKRVTSWIVKNDFIKYFDDIVTRKEKCDLFINKPLLNILKELPSLKYLCN